MGIILFECYRLCYHSAVIVTRFDALAINGLVAKDRILDGPPAETKKPPVWVAFLLVEQAFRKLNQRYFSEDNFVTVELLLDCLILEFLGVWFCFSISKVYLL